MEYTTYYVGKRYLYRGKIVKVIGETDSGNVKVMFNGEEVWTTHTELLPIDGATKGFRVLPLAA
jgi:hypothetical protein